MLCFEATTFAAGMRTTLALLLATLSAVQSTQERPPLSDDEAKVYLEKFGYITENGTQNMVLQRNRASVAVSQTSTTQLQDALKRFQQMAGLQVTGELDSATRTKMAQPRCGVSDVQAYSSGSTSLKWEKTALTYMFEKYTDDLTQTATNQAAQDAFNIWSAVTPLKFTAVTAGADIKIAFGRLSHGDPWPFDGKGQVLAHATLPYSTTRGLLHFDDDESWAYMDTQKLMSQDYVDLVTVAVHEMGHVLGLDHSSDQNAIMAPFYQDPLDKQGKYVTPKLGTDDITKIQALYGSTTGTGTSTSTCKDTLQNCNYFLHCWLGRNTRQCRRTCGAC